MRQRSAPAAKAFKGRKPTLSPTRIRTYLDCVVKYRYIYLERLGRFYLRAHPALSLGATLHQVLQRYHQEGAVQSAEQLARQLGERWISAGYGTPEEERVSKEAGVAMVVAYQEAYLQRAAAVETIATEKTLSHDMGRFRLAGRIDRIDRYESGELEIIDYKSGRTHISAEEVAADMAMNCYQLIVRRKYPEARVFGTIYCLRSGARASAGLTDDELNQFEADLKSLGSEILDRDYPALEPRPLPICPECDFLPRCARFWRDQERMDQ